MARARSLAGTSSRAAVVFALADAGRDAGYGEPVLDFGLVALAAALDLPVGGAVSMFAIGRTAGWIAHILEQYGAGFLLRPRARYVGAATTA